MVNNELLPFESSLIKPISNETQTSAGPAAGSTPRFLLLTIFFLQERRFGATCSDKSGGHCDYAACRERDGQCVDDHP